MRWLPFGVLLTLPCSTLLAQETPLRPFNAVRPDETPLRPFGAGEEPQVKRAIPVNPTRGSDDPAEVPSATPIPRPTPQVRRGRPVRDPGVVPASASPKPGALPAAPEPADPNELRMAPQSGRTPEQAQLAVADSYYNRKMYETAAPEYARFVDQYPGSDEIAAALFRLGECYRRSGSLNSAKNAYDSLLGRFQVGDFVGPAAFRLAELYYQERNYTSALPFFRKAALRVKEPPVINAAKFYCARCLEALGGAGNKLEASELYRDLADAARETNPYADASRLSLALLLRDADRTAEAVRNIQLLARNTENPDLRAEATARAGLWELELQQHAKATEDLKKALELPGLGKWKDVVQVGLLQVYYETAKYQQVLDAFQELNAQLSPELLPAGLLMAGNAERQLSHFSEALNYYDRIAHDFPNSASARDSAYQRLVCLYSSESPKLLAEIDTFLTNLPEPAKRDQVMLMKAESLVKKEQYEEAAAVYTPLTLSTQLSAPLRGEALFKLGWCSMQTRTFERAIKAYSQYIEDYPTSKQLCFARVQRALANQSLKNLAAAEKDYLEVIKRYRTCKDRELALEQEALIRGQMNDSTGMGEHFTTLLRDYPQSTGAAKAHYWLGRNAYDVKNYKSAAEHLAEARKLDVEQFSERATLLLMMANYYLEDREGVAREVALYQKTGKAQVPTDVIRWLGEQYLETKSFEKSETYLKLLAERNEALPRDLLQLGQAQLQLQKFPEAAATMEKYLNSVHEPVSRALGLLELAKARLGSKDFEAAQKAVDEALTLQPEGKISGEARIAAGDLQAGRGNWLEAAKIYLSVAAILDDEEVTPRALDKAVEAYRQIGKADEVKKTSNLLQSRYPEYLQRKKAASK